MRPKSSSASERVKVIVRCRPMSQKEIEEGHVSVVEVFPENGEIKITRNSSSTTNEATSEIKVISFDAVFDDRITQQDLYNEAVRPLVESILEGFNGTIFAYGQTGTGKTYTMEGIPNEENLLGVIPNAFKHIFHHIMSSPQSRYLVRASYLEIYQEEIRDLLSKDRFKTCELKEHGKEHTVYVKGLSSYFCSSFTEIYDLMTKGNKNRAVGATNMNEYSSRSHAIFTITVEVSETWSDGQEHIKVGELNLVDLAGSERQGKTGSKGERFKEATKINLSLSALGNVISSLVDGAAHIPYRDSKLTRLLQNSLGGNSRTVMVATIGPANYNWEETMNTLRYASRAKNIKNKPRINEDPKDAMLRGYQEEIARLKALLEEKKKQSVLNEQSAPEGHRTTETEVSREESIEVVKRNEKRIDPDSFSENIRLAEEQRLSELTSLLLPYGLDPSTNPQQIMMELEQRRETLLRDNETMKEEKDELLKKLKEATNHVKSTEKECSLLVQKIHWLESKVLNNGKSLLEHTAEQQKLIETNQKELEEQRILEQVLRQKLEEKELTTKEIADTLSALKSEFELKKKKYEKLSLKLKNTDTLKEMECSRILNEKEAILKSVVELAEELRLRRKVTENFIPPPVGKEIENRIRYHEEEDSYYVLPAEIKPLKRPIINTMLLSPLYTCKHAAIKPKDNVYYTNQNILQLEMELPNWKSKILNPDKTDHTLKALVMDAYNDVNSSVIINCNRFKSKNQPFYEKDTEYIAVGPKLVLRHLNPSQTCKNYPIPYHDCSVVSSTSIATIRQMNDQLANFKTIKFSTSSGNIKPSIGELYAMPLVMDHKNNYFDLDAEENDSSAEDMDKLLESLKTLDNLNKRARSEMKCKPRSQSAKAPPKHSQSSSTDSLSNKSSRKSEANQLSSVFSILSPNPPPNDDYIKETRKTAINITRRPSSAACLSKSFGFELDRRTDSVDQNASGALFRGSSALGNSRSRSSRIQQDRKPRTARSKVSSSQDRLAGFEDDHPNSRHINTHPMPNIKHPLMSLSPDFRIRKEDQGSGALKLVARHAGFQATTHLSSTPKSPKCIPTSSNLHRNPTISKNFTVNNLISSRLTDQASVSSDEEDQFKFTPPRSAQISLDASRGPSYIYRGSHNNPLARRTATARDNSSHRSRLRLDFSSEEDIHRQLQCQSTSNFTHARILPLRSSHKSQQ